MKTLFDIYGAYFWLEGQKAINQSRKNDLYHYTAYIGEHAIENNYGDSVIYLSECKNQIHWVSHERSITSKHIAVILRGYTRGNSTTELNWHTNLPYINGCSTKQIFHPERIGDPTLQQLTIPPYTSEQKHHIHPTARVVYVLNGKGYSIVGQSNNTKETTLEAGMVCILDPMCPHHFRTEDNFLTVLPIHIFSSTAYDNNHPMFNGTKEI
jgi:quercetin dioxygenase-like cupin family protein